MLNSQIKIWITCLALILPGYGSATALEDAAQALQAGEWMEISTSGFNANLLRQGDHHALQYQESMKWDPVRKQVHFVGSGHLQPYIHVVYDEASNAWSERGVPSYFGDSHGYDHMAIDVTGRKFYFRQFNGGRLEIYDLDNRTWTRSSTVAAGQWLVAGGLAWMPELNGIVFADSVQVSLYRPSGDSWSTLTTNTSGLGDYHNFAEYSPVHQLTIYGGGNGSNAIYQVDESGTVKRMGDAPIGMGIHQTMNVADPVSGNFLVFDDNGLWEYDPVNDSWTQHSVSIPYSNGTDPGVIGASAVPISNHGVIMIVKYDGNNSKVFLYRHNPGAGAPAPAITIPKPPVVE